MSDSGYSDFIPYKRIKEPRFEIFKDNQGQFRFRLIAPNNEIIAVSEAYTKKTACMNGVESVIQNASKAKIMDKT